MSGIELAASVFAATAALAGVLTSSIVFVRGKTASSPDIYAQARLTRISAVLLILAAVAAFIAGSYGVALLLLAGNTANFATSTNLRATAKKQAKKERRKQQRQFAKTNKLAKQLDLAPIPGVSPTADDLGLTTKRPEKDR